MCYIPLVKKSILLFSAKNFQYICRAAILRFNRCILLQTIWRLHLSSFNSCIYYLIQFATRASIIKLFLNIWLHANKAWNETSSIYQVFTLTIEKFERTSATNIPDHSAFCYAFHFAKYLINALPISCTIKTIKLFIHPMLSDTRKR